VFDVSKFITGQEDYFQPHSKGNYLTATLNCEFKLGAKNTKFEQVLAQYLPDPNKRKLLAQFIVAAMIPGLTIQKILFCIGTGGNGKGTIFSIISELFSALASNVKFHDLGDRWKPFGTYNKALNIDEDAVMHGLTQEAICVIKTITGDGTMIMDRKYGSPISCRPTFKQLIACNNIPSMGEANEAIARRFLALPFTEKVPKVNYGGFWQEVVTAEDGLSGIANWFIGYLSEFATNHWQFVTLASDKVKDEYFKEMDPVYGYISSLFETELNDISKFRLKNDEQRLSNQQLLNGVLIEQLYQDFRLYAQQMGIHKKLEYTPGHRFTHLFEDKLANEINGTRMIGCIKRLSGNKYSIDVNAYRSGSIPVTPIVPSSSPQSPTPPDRLGNF
jgi:phage/plasmid-associated DNA primase